MLSAARLRQYRQLKTDLEETISIFSAVLSPEASWPVSRDQRIRLDGEVAVYQKALDVCSSVYQLSQFGGDDTLTLYFRKRVIDAAIAFAGEVAVRNLNQYFLREQCMIIYRDFGSLISPDKENVNIMMNAQ